MGKGFAGLYSYATARILACGHYAKLCKVMQAAHQIADLNADHKRGRLRQRNLKNILKQNHPLFYLHAYQSLSK
jgi:cobalamin biosynthesis protein CbiD